MLWQELDDIRILIVEDDPFNRLLIKSMFENIPQISFIEAKDGIEALEALTQFKIDLILLDLYMPNMNGHETLVAIRKNKLYDDIAVIPMTTDIDDKHKFYKEGADDFIPKPFRLKEMETKIYHNIKLKRERIQDLQMKQYETLPSPSLASDSADKEENIKYSLTQVEISQKDFFHKMIILATKEKLKERQRTQIVALTAKKFALILGYGEYEASNIFSVALIRNIGLIGLRDIFIENKIFTQAERKYYQKYILLGYHPISSMIETNFIKIAKKVILQYNERYDGKGIPYQLSGEEISNEAMIVSIAETFEALLSDRAYRKRKSISPQESYSILYSERGYKFSPRLIDLFLQHYDIFVTLRNKLVTT